MGISSTSWKNGREPVSIYKFAKDLKMQEGCIL